MVDNRFLFYHNTSFIISLVVASGVVVEGSAASLRNACFSADPPCPKDIDIIGRGTEVSMVDDSIHISRSLKASRVLATPDDLHANRAGVFGLVSLPKDYHVTSSFHGRTSTSSWSRENSKFGSRLEASMVLKGANKFQDIAARGTLGFAITSNVLKHEEAAHFDSSWYRMFAFVNVDTSKATISSMFQKEINQVEEVFGFINSSTPENSLEAVAWKRLVSKYGIYFVNGLGYGTRISFSSFQSACNSTDGGNKSLDVEAEVKSISDTSANASLSISTYPSLSDSDSRNISNRLFFLSRAFDSDGATTPASSRVIHVSVREVSTLLSNFGFTTRQVSYETAARLVANKLAHMDLESQTPKCSIPKSLTIPSFVWIVLAGILVIIILIALCYRESIKSCCLNIKKRCSHNKKGNIDSQHDEELEHVDSLLHAGNKSKKNDNNKV